MRGSMEDSYIDAGLINPVGRLVGCGPGGSNRSSPTRPICVDSVAEVDKPLTQPDEHGCGSAGLREVSEEMADAQVPHSASGSAQL
jgi:hypothetical protein